jgi:hypothetical protein
MSRKITKHSKQNPAVKAADRELLLSSHELKTEKIVEEILKKEKKEKSNEPKPPPKKRGGKPKKKEKSNEPKPPPKKRGRKPKKKAEDDFEKEVIDDILHTFKKYNVKNETGDEYCKIRTPIKFTEDTIERLRHKPYSFSLLQIRKLMREIAASTNWLYLRHLIGADLVKTPTYIRCPYKLCNGDNRFITYKQAQNIHLWDEFNLKDKISAADLISAWFAHFLRHGDKFTDPRRSKWKGMLHFKTYGNTLYMTFEDFTYCLKEWATNLIKEGFTDRVYKVTELLEYLKYQLVRKQYFDVYPGIEFITCKEFYKREKLCTQIVNNIQSNNKSMGLDKFDLEKIYGYESLSSEQKLACEMCKKYRMLIITGPPGSGKTYFLVKYVKGLQFQIPNRKILLCAFFGKAVDTIQNTDVNGAEFGVNIQFGTVHKRILFGDLTCGNCPKCKCMFKKYEEKEITFNSLRLHIKNCEEDCKISYYDETKDDIEILKNSLKSNAPDTVFIDEASMLSLRLFSDILEILSSLKNNPQIIFIGDPEQLPSIGVGPLFELLINRGNLPVCRLTGSKRIEQFEDDDKAKNLYNFFQDIRDEKQNLVSKYGNLDKKNKIRYKSNIIFEIIPPPSMENNKCKTDYVKQGKMLEECLDYHAKKFNLTAENTKYLTAQNGDKSRIDNGNYDHRFNGSRKHLNKNRQETWNKDGIKIYKGIYDSGCRVKDKVQINSNDYKTGKISMGKQLIYFNGMEGTIVKVDYKKGNILVMFKRDEIKNDTIEERNEDLKKRDLPLIEKIAPKEYSIKDINHDLSLGYAMTVHKSQGSSIINTVIIINEEHTMWAEKKIQLSNGEWIETQNTSNGKKLFYTGNTRCKERLIIIILPKKMGAFESGRWVKYNPEQMSNIIINKIVKSKKKILSKVFTDELLGTRTPFACATVSEQISEEDEESEFSEDEEHEQISEEDEESEFSEDEEHEQTADAIQAAIVDNNNEFTSNDDDYYKKVFNR